MHPIEKRIRHFPDLAEWYSGSTTIRNTQHAGGGIEKSTTVIDIHEDFDPITAITATVKDHPSPANLKEVLDSRPDIIDDYDWPKATTNTHAKRTLYQARPVATTVITENEQPTKKTVFDPEHPGPSIEAAASNHFHEAPFGVLLHDEVYGTFCRGIRPHEFLRLMGEPDNIHLENEEGVRDTTRDILYVEGILAGTPVHIYVNHWPSRRDGASTTDAKRVDVAIWAHRSNTSNRVGKFSG